MHEGHKTYTIDLQYFAFFVLSFPRAPTACRHSFSGGTSYSAPRLR